MNVLIFLDIFLPISPNRKTKAETSIYMFQELEIGPQKTQVGVIGWSDGETVEFNLNEYGTKQDVIQATKYIKFVGKKSLW